MPHATEETPWISGAALGVPIVVVALLERASELSLMTGVTVKVYSPPASSPVAVYVYLSVVPPTEGMVVVVDVPPLLVIVSAKPIILLV